MVIAGHRGHADGFGHCGQRRYPSNWIRTRWTSWTSRWRTVQATFRPAPAGTELTDLSTYINETTQQMLDDETLSPQDAGFQQQRQPAAAAGCSPRMLETLRSKRISGIFLILNTHDFTDRTPETACPAFTCATSTRMPQSPLW